MSAVLLNGHGGLEMLEHRTDVAVPLPQPNEVLVKVAAAGMNNTDINTRTGWYSKAISGASNEKATPNESDAGWSGKGISFPRIQGADVCGYIVGVGSEVDSTRIGERVLIRNMLRTYVNYRPFECWTLGSECDGGFAEYLVGPSLEAYAVNCDWTDAELASVPCAFSTAENMLHRAGVGAERILVTGASGGVGSAAIKLAKRRGAHVIAVTSSAKARDVIALGADRIIDRDADLVAEIGKGTVDVVIDVVGGERWNHLLTVLRAGGRIAIAGAIAGPMSEIDLRTLYLKDLSVFGCTFQEDAVFQNLINYIETGKIQPALVNVYPLAKIAQAQSEFLRKGHTGSLVLVP